MGSCVSVHKNSQESAMKVGLTFASKSDNLIIQPLPLNSQSFNDIDSKDETFFDSRGYMDSDCDDDFFSVNGDFTPSRGNTPVHQNSFPARTPRIYTTEDGYPGSTSETSPGKKKKLLELFCDNSKEQNFNKPNTSINQDTANGKLEVKPTIQEILPSKSADGTPHVSLANSRCSSERTANGDNLMFKEKPLRSAQRCLPSLVSCSSFRERKKMSMQ